MTDPDVNLFLCLSIYPPFLSLSHRQQPHPHSAVIGELDPDKEATLDFSSIRAEPLGEIHH